MIEFRCPFCNVKIKAGDGKRGSATRCPKCREPIAVPTAPGLAASDPFDELFLVAKAEEAPPPDPEPIESEPIRVYRRPVAPVIDDGKRILAGLMGVLLGSLGIHKFVLGRAGAGLTMLAVTLAGICLFGVPSVLMHLIGFVEGLLYLTKSPEEFHRVYVVGRRGWF